MKQETTTFKVYFDGGTYGINPSAGTGSNNGYGSWEVCWNGFSKKAHRVPFLAGHIGQNVTNNVAEPEPQWVYPIEIPDYLYPPGFLH